MASSYSPHCKTCFLIRLQTTLLTLDRAVGASVARLDINIQALEGFTSKTAIDTNRKYLGSQTSLRSSNNVQESITVGFYWNMLECGLALIAACLPPTSYLFTHLKMQSISNKMRGCLSFKKVRSIWHTPKLSRGFDTSYTRRAPYGEVDQNSNASHAGIFHSSHLKHEQSHTQDLELGSLGEGIVLDPMV